jgi:hypothetical protein
MNPLRSLLLLRFCVIVLGLSACSSGEPSDYEIPYLAGESFPVYSPVPQDSSGPWFINDHCIISGPGDTLHFFGINNPYPTNEQTFQRQRTFYDVHPYLGHAVSTDPTTKWTRRPWALDDSKGEEYVGAPYVVQLKDGRYLMLLETRLQGTRTMEFAWSDDLYTWKRTYKSALPWLPSGTRDPCILHDGERYLIYLATPRKEGSAITFTATRDFKTFDTTRICLSIPDAIWYAGAESPYVLKRNGLYYLFLTYAHRHYYETMVYVSARLDHFSKVITTLYGHAPEIFEWKGRTYITSTGPQGGGPLDTHGLHVAELRWAKP